MSRICRAPGCRGAAAGAWSSYCGKHRLAAYRHGDPLANAFTKHEMGHYRRMVKAKRKVTKEAPFWGLCEERWNGLVRHAQSLDRARNTGQAYHRPSWIAARAVIQVAEAAKPSEVVEVVGAMWLARMMDPPRFVNDRHFAFQLVRRVRSLGDTLTATRWDHKWNKLRRMYQQPTPRAMETLAGWLAETLGGAGVNIAETIMEDERRKLEKRETFLATFNTIRVKGEHTHA